jgi:hypothetical protein
MIPNYEIRDVLKKWSFKHFTAGIVQNDLPSHQGNTEKALKHFPAGVKTIEARLPFICNRNLSDEELENLSHDDLDK